MVVVNCVIPVVVPLIFCGVFIISSSEILDGLWILLTDGVYIISLFFSFIVLYGLKLELFLTSISTGTSLGFFIFTPGISSETLGTRGFLGYAFSILLWLISCILGFYELARKFSGTGGGLGFFLGISFKVYSAMADLSTVMVG